MGSPGFYAGKAMLKAMELHDNFWSDYGLDIFPAGTKPQACAGIV